MDVFEKHVWAWKRANARVRVSTWLIECIILLREVSWSSAAVGDLVQSERGFFFYLLNVLHVVVRFWLSFFLFCLYLLIWIATPLPYFLVVFFFVLIYRGYHPSVKRLISVQESTSHIFFILFCVACNKPFKHSLVPLSCLCRARATICWLHVENVLYC